MPRPELSRVPQFYHNYINQVKGDELMQVLTAQTPAFIQFLLDIPVEKRDYRYADGKWTIKEVVQHIIDAERIFGYRSLCFARKDATSLPSFEENSYAANSKADQRDWNGLVEEFKAVRHSTEILFGSFDEEQLESSGTANNYSNYVRAIGFIIAGHANHHTRIIKELYL